MNQHYTLLAHLFATWEFNDDATVDFNSPNILNAYTGWFGLEISSTKLSCLMVDATSPIDVLKSASNPIGTIRFSPQPLILA